MFGKKIDPRFHGSLTVEQAEKEAEEKRIRKAAKENGSIAASEMLTRERIAMEILPVLLAADWENPAKGAVEWADALLLELERNK